MTELLEAGWSAIYLCMISLVFWWQLVPLVSMPDLVRGWAAEVWPFVPYAIVLDLAVDVWGRSPADSWLLYALKALALAGYFATRPPDDRWKRRRKRLAEKVSVRRGRLVVAPAAQR